MIQFKTHRLPNGLRMLHHFNASTQMVALNLLYDVGSRDENPEMTGLAHLMEHLMFAGSENASSFDQPLQAAGGESNAWTSADMTNYYEVVPKHNVETAFWLESDRLRALSLDDEHVNLQKSVVIEEFKQRYLNAPYGDLMQQLHSLAYTKHPYRWLTIGRKPEDIERMTTADVVDFYERHYSTSNLIMCVSGNIEFDEAVRLTEKWFGDIRPRAIAPRSIPEEPEQTEARLLSEKRTQVPHNIIYRAYHMCNRIDDRYVASDILSDVLAGGKSSRFFRNVVVPTGMFSELDASVLGSIDPGLFFVRAVLSSGVTFDNAERVIDDEINRLLNDGVTDYEVTKTVNKYLSTSLMSSVGYAQKATKLCSYELISGADAINIELDTYRALSAQRVNEVARQIFRPQNVSTLYYGPNA